MYGAAFLLIILMRRSPTMAEYVVRNYKRTKYNRYYCCTNRNNTNIQQWLNTLKEIINEQDATEIIVVPTEITLVNGLEVMFISDFPERKTYPQLPMFSNIENQTAPVSANK